MKEILKKKIKPRIKARIRKNKQIINKNIDKFFDTSKNPCIESTIEGCISIMFNKK